MSRPAGLDWYKAGCSLLEGEDILTPVKISYYSDVLCIWAYVAERRLEKLVQEFGGQIRIEARFCSVFPDAWGKIETNWGSRAGFAGFNRHLNEVAEKFPHIEVNEDLWRKVRPRTSASGHLFLKAIEIEARDQGGETDETPYFERRMVRVAAALRRAFFASGRDISDWQCFAELAEELGLNYGRIEARIRSSEAVAALAADYDLAQKLGVIGSPTFLMNEGRQKLFGNVGYRLLEANVQELLHDAAGDEASWC
jgi:predicted DsbA family dithiol-disulfide isomerase